jgi:hypothetical protein
MQKVGLEPRSGLRAAHLQFLSELSWHWSTKQGEQPRPGETGSTSHPTEPQEGRGQGRRGPRTSPCCSKCRHIQHKGAHSSPSHNTQHQEPAEPEFWLSRQGVGPSPGSQDWGEGWGIGLCLPGKFLSRKHYSQTKDHLSSFPLFWELPEPHCSSSQATTSTGMCVLGPGGWSTSAPKAEQPLPHQAAGSPAQMFFLFCQIKQHPGTGGWRRKLPNSSAIVKLLQEFLTVPWFALGFWSSGLRSCHLWLLSLWFLVWWVPFSGPLFAHLVNGIW